MIYSFPKKVNPNFAEFIVYDRFFNKEETKRIRSLWNETETVDATLSGSPNKYDDELRSTKIQFIDKNDDNLWIYEKLTNLAIHCNSQRFAFDIEGFYDLLQLALYQENDHFNWHMDFAAGEISNRKLSLSVQLSDKNDYEGGELQFMINDKEIRAPKDEGTVIIFPSFILHRVKPVKSGKRFSIVAWACGAPFR